MKLIDLFYEGGPLFMSIITIWGIGMLVFSVQKIIHFFVQQKFTQNSLGLILLFGSLAIVTGFLGQAIGMLMAFDAIEAAGDISPALIAGGLKVSMITPLYGTIIFIFSLIVWGVLREILIRKTEA
ncbi:MotA/TolQ/ExbB proton channel family protein [Gaoshiqia sediminis]|uniref:MotA/TolQ/ExbB proton channel family protein n=1 Tax=Gaoshiqia sediminis TaxID=2986998 RepID=A0AA41Y5U8_9BACT|nr:MotA/TolQ/ExbB proton channel family protein [Gaoshiqia sediminis]MCW0483959.1 MotA/TolQ/ExbB proton channel family protein [Gaoshiqia sediminis]